MAAISGLECLEHPSRQDLVRFSRLFMPLYAAASPDVRRTASATLSRIAHVPDDVVEMLVNEPIAIAAPFIAHYPRLKESTLARAVLRRGAPHARAAARRSDLSPQAIMTLRRLNDPSVDGLLILRGLIPDPSLAPGAAPAPEVAPAPAIPAPSAPPADHGRPSGRPVVAAPPLDPSEQLRAELRALAVRKAGRTDPVRRGAAAASDDADAPATPALRRPARLPVPTVGMRAPAQPLNRPTSTRAKKGAIPASRSAPLPDPRIDRLTRHARPNQESWFATALADAMDASYPLAERIMMDLSGRQLATAMIALGAPVATINAALESFFPHLAEPAAPKTLAAELVAGLDPELCLVRLQAWQRADRYTTGGSLHVPALAEGKPVRRDPVQTRPRQDAGKDAGKDSGRDSGKAARKHG
ncbi:hypothetical protein [Hoeflea olei]|nr:hypothetical protein [Hoeflea olei]